MKNIRFLALVIILSGCAVSDDPRQGGFFGGIKGIYGGGYNERIKERRDEVNNQKAASEKLTSENTALTNQVNTSNQEIVNLKKSNRELKFSLDNIERDINSLAAKTDKQKADVVSAKKRISDLRIRMEILNKQVNDAKDPSEVQNLTEKRDALSKEFADLQKYQSALSKQLK